MASIAATSSQRFWDRLAERYSKKPVPDEAAYQKKLELTRDFLAPDLEVFEFGCGTGSTAIAHAPYVRSIRAVDVSAKMLAIATRKSADQNARNITFERATIEELEIPGATYDVVMGHSILHLLRDRDAAIEKVYRILKPGGVFVSSTACIADHMKFFALVAPIGHFFRLIPYVSVFTSESLIESLTRTGFELELQWQPGKGQGVFIIGRKPE